MDLNERLRCASHELRNALGPIAVYLEILRHQGADHVTIAKIENQLAEVMEIVKSLTEPMPSQG
jgi:hypothetical protein